jgi:hypothetical protein
VNSLTEDELGVIRDIIEKKIYCWRWPKKKQCS